MTITACGEKVKKSLGSTEKKGPETQQQEGPCQRLLKVIEVLFFLVKLRPIIIIIILG